MDTCPIWVNLRQLVVLFPLLGFNQLRLILLKSCRALYNSFTSTLRNFSIFFLSGIGRDCSRLSFYLIVWPWLRSLARTFVSFNLKLLFFFKMPLYTQQMLSWSFHNLLWILILVFLRFIRSRVERAYVDVNVVACLILSPFRRDEGQSLFWRFRQVSFKWSNIELQVFYFLKRVF